MKHADLSTQILSVQGTEQFVLDGAELVVKVGPDKGATLGLEVGPQRIGTAADCDLVLSDRSVSAHHAEVLATTHGFLMRDLGSKNSIRLGPWQVQSVMLADRMKLRLGATTLRVRATTEPRRVLLHSPGELEELVVNSVAMRAVATDIQQYAQADLPVLIDGETGTGKEVAARALHALSPRSNGPFVVVDLPGIPATLMAAELFGHEQGAFTGADDARPGLFEEADEGTLFLDEVGELPLDVQPVLLRAVERRVSRRVGGKEDIPHDVRIIAATNRNLAEEVRAGRFRQDLYYRLAVGRLSMPPLRVRREDIPLLARQFAEEESCVLSPELTSVLLGYDWPGNVRELRNAIARVAAMPESAALEPEEQVRSAIPAEAAAGEILPLHQARRQAVLAFEREYLERVLEAADGSIAEAARLAQVSHSFMSRLNRKLRRD
jgi:DNA-binding NtrC family response regulator